MSDPKTLVERLDPRRGTAARLRFAGVATLAAGVVFALWARFLADLAPAAEESFSRTRLQELQLERLGGRFAVMAARFTDWFDGLWSGDNLPISVLVVAAAAAAVLFWLAGLAAIDVDGDKGDERSSGSGE